ncbi:6-phosphofructokinase [Oceanobacillus sp. CFH 90083]|uniref:6-phosphofructokinase n=1 Tax=Oceanobacillus sp. CFH 90083 TaxID=2592336 RepID=UPI00128D245A
MKKVAVLTSGGDAPGMNAAISSIVKHGSAYGMEIYGVSHGYEGLINHEISRLRPEDTEDTIHCGGTFLRSARSEYFKTAEGQKQAIAVLKEHGMEGVIVIGGNGSLEGAMKLSSQGIPAIVIPATIDNDVNGTEYAIGFDTAVNTVVESIDKVKETAASIERTVIVEVMGRDAGDIALWAGIGTDAESIITPEADFDINQVISRIEQNQKRGRMHNIIVLAEGAYSGEELKQKLQETIDLEIRVLVLGYLQRGGAPSAYDRILAHEMGKKALDLFRRRHTGVMVAVKNGKITEHAFVQAADEKLEKSTFGRVRSVSE